MSKIHYCVYSEERISPDSIHYTAYGIRAFSGETLAAEIGDISTDLHGIINLVESFNRNELQLENFRECVEDFALSQMI